MKEELTLIDSWDSIGIHESKGQTKSTCPNCSESRKHKHEKCLSINFEKDIANCKNCSIVYKVKSKDYMSDKKIVYPTFKQLPFSKASLKFFKSRGIEEDTLRYFRASEAMQWMYDKTVDTENGLIEVPAGETLCLAFNYYFKGIHVNTKFRATYKRFSLVKEAKLVFYNIDAVKDADWCAIQEGEIDTMSAYQCNVINSISVPNGASLGQKIKLEYLDNCLDFFENKKKIIIAVDGDSAGRALKEELIRRLGAERCWTIEYPDGCKDTNEVLIAYGKDAVKKMYDEAEQVPLEGLFSEKYIQDSVFDIYENGFPETVGIGYRHFDKLLRFKGGELTIFTGVPSHGKTTFLDQIVIKLAARHDWNIGIFSPENDTPVHVHKLIAKYMGEPTIGPNRISKSNLAIGTRFILDHFSFMKYDEMKTTITGILDKAKELVSRKGINALIIDPYNCIEHKIPQGYTETQYISELLSKLTTFAKVNNIHIFLVAHPVKMEKDASGKYEVPTLYKISGSSNFYNKTDNGIVVYLHDGLVQIHVQKVKFDYVGERGVAEFNFDKPTGRYVELGDQFENEHKLRVNRLQKAESGAQIGVSFVDQSSTQEPQAALTDINKLPIGSSFLESPVKGQIEKEFEESFYNEDGSLKPNLNAKTPF